jgi:putative membrane-bound dehydrogenase-like protein
MQAARVISRLNGRQVVSGQSAGLVAALVIGSVAFLACQTFVFAAANANRLTYLDETEPFNPDLNFPRLATPQWVGESGVEAVIILAIDDMKSPEGYQSFLQPIVARLKEIDGRAHVSIMCNALDPGLPQLQGFLKDGVSLEVHTLSHPCPILAGSEFQKAADTFHDAVELLNQVPGNKPVAFRTPCCDSINSPSPRLFAELLCQTNSRGQFLTIDSSVMNVLSARDPLLPKELVVEADGRDKFLKYLPFKSFQTTIENYPYPYVIDRLCWEFPAAVPSDWEAFHLHGANNPITVADWKSGLDATMLKQGLFAMIFHPHGWMGKQDFAALVDWAANKYGKRLKFLNFREAQECLNRNLLSGQPLRAANGQDNGVRLLDLNNDGYVDVVIGNEQVQKTRIWEPQEQKWFETSFPTRLIDTDASGNRVDTGVRFGVLTADGLPMMLVRNEKTSGAWRFDGKQWVEDVSLLQGLELNGEPVFTSRNGRERGVRLRDVDNDGICELIVGNESQNAVFGWSAAEKRWKKLSYSLPAQTSIVDAEGNDNGLRFVDVNGDGFADVIFSNAKRFSFHLFIAKPWLGFDKGWSREVMAGNRSPSPRPSPPGEGEIPMIVRDGPHRNNGAWFHENTMWVQNEDTAKMPDLVDRRTFKELMAGGLPPAKSPEESLASMHPRPGFKVELVASEPLTKSPIAFDWGADGKLWIVEMGDYPLGLDGKGKPGGIVRFLEDTKGDGHYDKSTVFLEGLPFPTGLIPWRKGVIVCDPPEIFYAEDTDGDGRADKHVTLFTGFGEGNQQHRANGFDYGLDNWLYGANGNSGGTIRSATTGRSVNINGRDFRFRPYDGGFEPQNGQAQYGRHRDDWGNWFGIENASAAWHYFPPENYLARNPYLAVRRTRQIMPRYEDNTRVFATSRMTQRFNDPSSGANHLTSANSVMPYRDDLFGPEFATSYFVSEPVHNLIHREIMEPDGVTFSSHRAPDEQTNEFLSSSDNWFRPTMTKTGPDGALYVADIYRQVIEHPEWIPMDAQQSLDLRAGADMGRIYRIYPEGTALRKIPRLDKLDTAGLVAAMESPNGWQRDTAQRLLVESGERAAIAPLEKLARESPNAKTRLQALCTLDGLGELKPPTLVRALADSHPAVREHALRLSEKFFDKSTVLVHAALALTNDQNVRVQCQLAFSLGEWHDAAAGRVLAQMALKNPANKYLETAVLSSATNHLGEMLRAVLTGGDSPTQMLKQLIGFAVAMHDEPALVTGLSAIASSGSGRYDLWQFDALGGLLDALHRRGQTLAEFQAGHTDLRDLKPRLADLFAQARERALDSHAAESDRLSAIRLLGSGPGEDRADLEALGHMLEPQNSQAIQSTALATLASSSDQRVADIMLAAWKSSSPSTRVGILETLFTRQEWIQSLLATIEAGKISPGAIGPVHQQKLLNYPQGDIRQRAAGLFAIASDRQAILKRYETVKELKGDGPRGAGYFRQNCTPCHHLGNEGSEVGPDLGSVAFKPIDYLLTAILDPNRAVESRYTGYLAVTKNDQEYSGVIAAETANSITMRLAGGSDVVILRSELKDLSSTGRSLMPDGFESTLNPQAMADLISFINSTSSPKVFPGNTPALIEPKPDNSFSLLAANCKIFGDTLVFEDQYRNLGYWNSETDRAVWSLNVAQGGKYDVWCDWALEADGPVNSFRLEAGDSRLAAKIPATGSWDVYRQSKFGSITLQTGRQNVELRAEGPFKGALLDLREIRLMPSGKAAPADFPPAR